MIRPQACSKNGIKSGHPTCRNLAVIFCITGQFVVFCLIKKENIPSFNYRLDLKDTNMHDVPLPPEITKDQLTKCRETGDYSPILFEWYKYVGILCNFYASIHPDSPCVRKLPSLHYAVLVGLLNRCSRLMLANVALSHEGRFGETTAILDRCIFESAIKTIWICTSHDEESFVRFIADGLKTEIEFKEKIDQIISERGGGQLIIEARMLKSINRYIAHSGLSEQEIVESKKLPDLASIIDSIGGNRLLYIVGQKLGSHHVHGTWISLRHHYLKEHNGLMVPRDHDCETHVNQYAFIPLFVIYAVRAFIRYICCESDDAKGLSLLLHAVEDKIMELYSEVVGNDFEKVYEDYDE